MKLATKFGGVSGVKQRSHAHIRCVSLGNTVEKMSVKNEIGVHGEAI